MASSWYLINNSPVYNNGYENEEIENYKYDALKELLGEDLPISNVVQIINSDLSVTSEFRAIVQNNTSDGVEKSYERSIVATIGILSTGDYIKYDNRIWLVSSAVGNNNIYEKAIMQLTNFIIKFQHPTTGAILSYPCITSNKTQGTGENEGKYITLPDGRKSVLLPFDESTILLRNGNRFFLDKHPTEPTPYKITHVDTTTYNYGDKGLIELIVVEDQLQDDDRPDLGVCDYFEPTTPSNPVEGGYVKINTDSLIVGFTTTLIPTFYSEDGIVQNGLIALWDINKPDRVTVSCVDNKCKITVPDDYDFLNQKVVVTVSDTNGNYSSTFELVIRGW